MTATPDTIQEQFEEMGIEPSSEVLAKSVDLCITYNITDAVEFVEQWMAFSLSNLNGAEPTVSYLADFERKEFANRKDILNAKKKNRRTTDLSHLIADNNCLKIYGNNGMSNSMQNDNTDVEDDIMDSYACKTPKATKTVSRISKTPALQNDALFSPVSYSPISGTPRAQSEKSGKIVYTFGNPNLVKSSTWTSTKKQNIVIKQILTDDNQVMNTKSRYMFDTLMEKSSILGDRLFDIGKALCKRVFEENIIDYDLNNVDIPGGDDIIKTVGRIACDFDAKLDPTSTILVGTDEMRCRTVRLNFSKTKSFGVFPGQTVMISGINPRGDTLFVDEVISDRILPIPKPPKLTDPLSLVLVSGPYTNYDDLVYDPLHDLVTYCKDNKPDVLIMTGPFMEADHSLIVSNTLAEAFESFFEKMISGIVEALGTDITICMVSSCKDAISSMVYPTHPNSTKKTYSNVHMLPDPCIVDINGLTIGLTSTDIIGHLLDDELAVNAGDKIKRAVNYLFHQASFYPLNPPSLDVSVDTSLANKFAKLDSPPNIMVLPSNQKCFIRDVSGSLSINPGRLTDKTGGTFARMVVQPQSNEEANLFSYVACQIMRV